MKSGAKVENKESNKNCEELDGKLLKRERPFVLFVWWLSKATHAARARSRKVKRPVKSLQNRVFSGKWMESRCRKILFSSSASYRGSNCAVITGTSTLCVEKSCELAIRDLFDECQWRDLRWNQLRSAFVRSDGLHGKREPNHKQWQWKWFAFLITAAARFTLSERISLRKMLFID